LITKYPKCPSKRKVSFYPYPHVQLYHISSWHLVVCQLWLSKQRFPKVYESSYILTGYNVSFITLVLNKENLMNLSEFRPIFLVGCVHKIITKVLANKFKLILPKFFHSSQSTFLSDWRLSNNILVANEVIDEINRSKNSGVIVKVD